MQFATTSEQAYSLACRMCFLGPTVFVWLWTGFLVQLYVSHSDGLGAVRSRICMKCFKLENHILENIVLRV
eukprot:SAG11_NODE_3229_length_2596_cov_1.746496_2_plen_71_part_00